MNSTLYNMNYELGTNNTFTTTDDHHDAELDWNDRVPDVEPQLSRTRSWPVLQVRQGYSTIEGCIRQSTRNKIIDETDNKDN